MDLDVLDYCSNTNTHRHPLLKSDQFTHLIANNGRSIPEYQSVHLFEPFFTTSQGTGLGITIDLNMIATDKANLFCLPIMKS